MRTSIKLYEINTAFHEAMILCFRILLTKDFDVIKKDVARRHGIFLGCTMMRTKLTRTGRRVKCLA